LWFVANRLSAKRRKLRNQAVVLMLHIGVEFRIAGTICLYCFLVHVTESRFSACGTGHGVLALSL
jgi:hypothetical protein